MSKPRKLMHLFPPVFLAVFAALGPFFLWPLVVIGYLVNEIFFLRKKKLFWLSATRVSIFMIVVGGAYFAPVKYLDREVKPSEFEFISNGKISTLKGSTNSIWLPSAYSGKGIWLSNKSLSLKSFLEDIEKQTGLTHRVYYCGTGANLLFGAFPTQIWLHKRSPYKFKNENTASGSGTLIARPF